MQSLKLISQQDLRAQASVRSIKRITANRQEVHLFCQAQVYYFDECFVSGMFEPICQ
jgi:hypothetical protein